MSGAAPDVTQLVQQLVREEIRALSAYHVPSATGMVKLDAMENPYRLPEAVRAEIGRAVADALINRYPDPAAPELAAALRRSFNIPAGAGLLIGNGSDEIITIVTQTLAKPGAVMLAPDPSFAMFRMNAVFSHMRFVGVPLNADFSLDAARFVAALDEHQPALVFLAYPNNPTGNLYPEEDVVRILRAAPGLVVVDEAYFAFAGKSFMPRLAEFPNLIVMRTVSKIGMAGLRLGYAAAAPELMAEFNKVRPPYNVGVATQIIATVLLGHIDLLNDQAAKIRAERGVLAAGLAKLPGVQIFPSEANFILARFPDGQALFESLKAQHVLVKNFHGSHPMLANCLRLTVGTPEENSIMLKALAQG
ncbi:MAG: histidinol-phosphate transaminase [Proteobacteria bacterium]|nr:histidinol-phosphate transaminase [Pseudomonadota bacterium]